MLILLDISIDICLKIDYSIGKACILLEKEGVALQKQVVSTNTAPAAIGPYSQAIIANGLLFLSGQIPIEPETGNVPDGIEAQTQQVLKNMSAILTSVNLSTENVVKTTIFLKNMDDFATVNAIYATYFPTNPPARSTVQIARLPKDVLIEIEAIATGA